MYKCPKCGSTESFAVYGTLTIPNRWFNVDSDGKVIDAGTDLESASYIEYEAEDKNNVR